MTIAIRPVRLSRALAWLAKQLRDTAHAHEWRPCDVFRCTRLITGETVPAFTRLMRRRMGEEWQFRRLTAAETVEDDERNWQL